MWASTRSLRYPTSSMPFSRRRAVGIAGAGSCLSRLLVFPVHRHALSGQDMRQRALVAELAVALDEPGADLLLLAGLEDGMGEGTGRAGGT